MIHAARWLLGLSATLCSAHVAAVWNDEVSLIHDFTRVRRHRIDWPDIGNETKKAAESVEKAVASSVEGAANATAVAIDSVVDTGYRALVKVSAQASDFGSEAKDIMGTFVAEVSNNATLNFFERRVNKTLATFLKLFVPVIGGMNATDAALRGVLNAAGFLYLSQEVSNLLTAAVNALNETSSIVVQTAEFNQNIANRKNTSDGRITRAVNGDLKKMQVSLQAAVDEMNLTFSKKLTQSFDLLSSHLTATVAGVLPAKYLRSINESLSSLLPQVQYVVENMTGPIISLSTSFNQTIEKVRMKTPEVEESSALRAAGRGLAALGAGLCVAFSVL